MSRYKTPLRYPGGKQKLAPFVLEILGQNGLLGGHYAEPFAGGAGVAIELLLSNQVSHIHLNDSYYGIYAFWRAVLTKNTDFCRRVASASLNVGEWKRQRDILWNPKAHSQFDVGFSLFYLNRCNRSGIPTGGVIGGLLQEGKWKIDARFPRKELVKRIEAIGAVKSKITIKNVDAEEFITKYVPILPRKTLVYCDPPYFLKADRLYKNHYRSKDHIHLSAIIQKRLKRPWLVSYDGAPEILEMYSERKSFIYLLQYNAARAYRGKEVFIFYYKLTIPRR
jgi:DNA adenine methylase